jgi:hypothetical protein
MGACRVKDRGVFFGNCANLRFQPQLCADGDHTRHASRDRACDNVVALCVEVGKIKVAMTVDDCGLGHLAAFRQWL